MSDVDHRLHSEVAHVRARIELLDERLEILVSQVRALDVTQGLTRSEVQQLHGSLGEFVRTFERTAKVQRAETRIAAIRDLLDREFGHHKSVRRAAVGILQGLDTGLLSDEVIRDLGEQHMIQTPRYWLAPALVALAAWSANDPARCERAVEEAFRRSPQRTSLLFTLILRRQNRHASAVRWLRHYLLAQDPRALGRDFTVVLESISHGAFGPAGRTLLGETLDTWHGRLVEDQRAEQAQVIRWRAEIERLRGETRVTEFPRLAELSPQWATLEELLTAAATQGKVLAKYTALMDRTDPPSARIEDAIDDILDLLVTEYDVEELPLRRDLAVEQAVVDHDGDDDRSAWRAAHTQTATFDATLDYLTLQSTAALDPSVIGASAATQKLAVAACHGWFAQAHESFTRAYADNLPQDVEVRFETAHTVGAQTFALPPWSGSFTRPLDELERSLGEHWDRNARPFIRALRMRWGRATLVRLPVLLGILLVVGVFHPAVVPVTVLIVFVFVFGPGLLFGRLRAARKRQHLARQALDVAKLESLHRLRAARAELTDWQTCFLRTDAEAEAVRRLIARIGTTSHAGAPHEGRVVTPEGVGR